MPCLLLHVHVQLEEHPLESFLFGFKPILCFAAQRFDDVIFGGDEFGCDGLTTFLRWSGTLGVALEHLLHLLILLNVVEIGELLEPR